MSDTRLRELARRWRETGAPQDEAALIVERIRVGELKRERVRAAAILGYPAASLVMTHHKHQKRSFIHALKVHGVGAQGWIRALVIIQRKICADLNFRPTPALILYILQLAWRWAHVSDCRHVVSEAWNEGNNCGLAALDLGPRPEVIAFRFAGMMTWFLRHPSDDFSRDLNEFVWQHGHRSSLSWLTFKGMQPVVGPELGAWLLGYADPLPRNHNPVYESAGAP